MIDSINSLAAAVSALMGTGPAAPAGSGDPAFMQILEAIAGQTASGDAPGLALETAITAAARGALPGGDLAQGLLSLTQNEDVQGLEVSGAPDKKEVSGPETALGMVLALLAAAASQIQPWQVQPQDAGKTALPEAGEVPADSDAVSTGAETVGLSPHERLLQLQQALAGQGIFSPLTTGGFNGILPKGSLPDRRAAQEPAATHAPTVTPDIPKAAATEAQPGAIPARASAHIAQTIAGKDVQPAQGGKSVTPDAQPVWWAAPDPEAPKGAPVRDPSPGRTPEATPAPLAGVVAPVAWDSSSGTPARAEAGRTAARAGNAHSPGTLSGDGRVLTVDRPDESGSASQDGTFKHDAAWRAPLTVDRMGRLDTAGEGSLPASAPAAANAALVSASVIEQIARRAHLLLSRGRAGLNIQLEPKELGKVRVYVGLGSEGLHVKLAAETSDTRGMLQASLPQLREALESQGLRVDRFDLAFGSGASSFGSPQDNAQQQPRMAGGPAPQRYAWEDDTTPELAGSGATPVPDSLVDYRI